MTQTKLRLSDWLNVGGLFLIGGFSLAYSVFFRHFAEIHVQLPFLNFPIFVGEILLAACLLILLLKWKCAPIEFNKFHYFLLAYVVWLLSKALHGYFTFGPLAFRNAALFYYPLFLLLGFSFYDRKLFSQKVILILLVGLTMTLFTGHVQRYFCFAYLGIGCAFLLNLKDIRLKVVLGLILFFAFPFNQLFEGARAHLLSVIGAFLFVGACLIFKFLKGKKVLQITSVFAMLIFFVTGIGLYSNKMKLKSLMSPQIVLEAYRANEQRIKDGSRDFHFKEIRPQLYNPEQRNLTTYLSPIKPFEGDVGEIFVEAKEMLIEQTAEEITVQLMISSGTAEPGEGSGENGFVEVKEKVRFIVEEEFVEFEEKMFLMSDEAGETIKRKGSASVESVISQTRKESRVYSDEMLQGVKDRVITASVNTELSEEVVGAIQESIDSLAFTKFSDVEKEIERLLKIYGGTKKFETEYTNILFRVYIWQDMIEELFRSKAILGVNLGKPQRSKSIEILGLAWGEWTRDGWITPHNSFLHMIYRAGIVGIFFIVFLFFWLIKATKRFLKLRCLTGIISMTVIVYGVILSNFLVILEFPYHAIPFWSLVGVMFAYYCDLGKITFIEESGVIH